MFCSSSKLPGETPEEYAAREKALEDIKKFQDVYRRSVDGHNCQLSDTKQGSRIFGNVAQPFVVAKIFKGLASIVQLRRGAQAAELAVSLEEAAALQRGRLASEVVTGAKAEEAASKAMMEAAKKKQAASELLAGEGVGETITTAQKGKDALRATQTSRTAATKAKGAQTATQKGKAKSLSTQGQKEQVRQFKKKKPNISGKEGAKGVPDWVKEEGLRPYVGESGKEFAKRVMDAKYGKGNWDPKNTGPESEFSKIKKYADRSYE